MSSTPADVALRRGEALLHEDLITPLHHHDEAHNRLLAHLGDGTRVVTPAQANELATTLRPAAGIDEVEQTAGGPRKLPRRGLLRGTVIGLGGLLAASTAPRYSFAADSGADLLVCVFLRGGFDGLSAVVPVNDANYIKARGTIAVKDSSIALDPCYALSPQLSALKPIWAAGELAIVLGSGHPDVERSHFEDQDLCERAAKANLRSGWLGRHIATSSAQSGTFRAITIGTQVVTSLTTTAHQSLAMSSLDSFDLNSSWWTDNQRGRANLIADLERLYGDAGGVMASQANATLDAVAALKNVRGTTYKPYGGASYPATDWGKGLKEIARLAKAGMGLEVACIDYDGWDLHQNSGLPTDSKGAFSAMARDFTRGLAALRTDLQQDGRWQRVTVIAMSEFGRRVAVNGDGGTDHGMGNTLFILGGSIKGGRLYGSMPTLTKGNLEEGMDVPITTDYRQPLSEILTARLKNPKVSEVFPDFAPGKALGIA